MNGRLGFRGYRTAEKAKEQTEHFICVPSPDPKRISKVDPPVWDPILAKGTL